MAEILEKEDTIRLRLVTNPFDTSRVIDEELVFNSDYVLADYMQGLPSPDAWVVGYNGMALRRDLWETVAPNPGDMISLVRVPEGGDGGKNILRMVALLAIAIAAPYLGAAIMGVTIGTMTAGAFIVAAAISVAGSLLVNALLPPPMPDLNDGSGKELSPSYGIDGPKNTNQQGFAVPVGYGQYRIGGNFVDLYTENLGDTQYLFGRLVLNDGEIEELTDIEINDQPIANYLSVQTRVAIGLETETANDWFPQAVKLVNRGVKVESTYTVHTTEGPVDKVRLDLIAPNGLVRFDDKGKEQAVAVVFDIEYRVHGTSAWSKLPVRELTTFTGTTPLNTNYLGVQTYAPGALFPGQDYSYQVEDFPEYRPVSGGAWVPFNTTPTTYNAVPGMNFTPDDTVGIGNPGYEGFYDAYVPEGQYEVRYNGGAGGSIVGGVAGSNAGFTGTTVYRMSGASTRAQRKSLESVVLPRQRYDVRILRTTPVSTNTQVSDTVYLTDVGEIDLSQVRMNGTATLSLRIKVTDQINNTPKVTALCKFSKLREYDEDGNFVIERWSNNPAWITLDILTNPVRGAGLPLSRIDWPAWVELARHCEEKNLEFNGIFDALTSVWDATQSVLRCGHAQFVRMGTKWSVSIDRASDPVMLFTDSNIMEGSLNTTWLPMADRATEIQLSYAEKEDNYKQRTIRLVDQEIAVNGVTPRASSYQQRGITNLAQATAEAEYQLRRNRLIRKTISFDAPIEAIGLSIGEVALIQYQAGDYAGGAGGRIKAGSTASNIQLDRPVVVEAGQSYRLLIHHAAVKRYDVNVVAVSGKTAFVSGLPAGDINRCTRLRKGGVDLEILNIVDGSPNDAVKLVSADGLTTGAAELWDTNVIEERTVTTGVGEHGTLSVSGAFSVVPTTYANWMFGKVTKVKQPFRLVGIGGEDVNSRTLSFMEYDDRLYLPPGTALPGLDITPAERPQQVRDISIEYQRYPTGDTPTLIVNLTWNVANVLKYGGADIYLNNNGAGWRQVKSVSDVLAATVEIREGITGLFKVVGFDKQGRRASFYDAPVFGFSGDISYRQILPPTNLTVDSRRYDILNRLTVSWDAPADEPVTLYRVDYRPLTLTQYNAIAAGDPVQPLTGATQSEVDAWNASFKPGFVTTDVSGVIDNLAEGYYSFRVRAERGQSASRWEVITHILDIPEFIAVVTNLQLDGGGNQFSGRDASFKWDDIYTNAAASATGDIDGIPFLLKHYQVEVLDTGGNVIRTETVENPAYTYNYDKNVADSTAISDTARRSFTIRVKAVGRQGQESSAAQISVTNPPPVLPSVEVVSLYGSVLLKFSQPTDPDFEGMIVWKTAVNGMSVDIPPGAPVFQSLTSVSFAENGTGTVYTAFAVDPNGQTITYSISGGVDAARFNINGSTGALTFVTSPDFEAPVDANGDNIYNITLRAAKAADPSLFSTRNLAITVTDVVEGTAPSFTSGTTASFAENGTGTAYTAAASGSSPITYSIVGGVDAARFNINSSTGAVTFVTSPDFEIPTDSNADNAYQITVRAANSLGTVDLNVTITVTDVAEGFAPTFTSGTTASFDENGTGTVYTAVATGSGPITYSIVGGTDAARFNLDGSTGALTFVATPDFEAPTDANADNVYNVTIRATNSFGSVDRAVAVTVNDVVEGTAPVFTSGTTASFAENGTGTAYTAAATGTGPISYSILAGDDAARFSINSSTGAVTFNTPPDFENPTDVGANNVYNFTVRATNSFGSVDRNVAIAVTDVVEGTSPVFTSGTTANFAENGTGTAYTAVATGSEPISYSILAGSDAARFSVNSSTGAVTFNTPPDFENPTDVGANNVYNFTVRATNSFGTADRAVAITVTDVFEGVAPTFTSGTTASFAEGATGTVYTAAANGTAPITFSIVGGADAARFSVNSSTGALTFNTSPNYSSPTDSNGDNIYNVTIRATNSTGTADRAVAVTVTQVASGDAFMQVLASGAYTKTEVGTDDVYVFTGAGTFDVTQLGSDPTFGDKVEYLVIGGGGGGGNRRAGGGGAGGYRTNRPDDLSGGNSASEAALTIAAQSYTVVVGAGGIGGQHPQNATTGQSGGVSSVFGIVSQGGGPGGRSGNLSGASSGGGAYGATGLTSNPIAGQGMAGWVEGSDGSSSNGLSGGGGGGAGQAGNGRTPEGVKNGGDGLASTITGSSVVRAGGGGGGYYPGLGGGVYAGTNTPGGTGGGGFGGATFPVVNGKSGGDAVPNTGSGGGGGGQNGFNAQDIGFAGDGGSGLVVVRVRQRS